MEGEMQVLEKCDLSTQRGAVGWDTPVTAVRNVCGIDPETWGYFWFQHWLMVRSGQAQDLSTLVSLSTECRWQEQHFTSYLCGLKKIAFSKMLVDIKQ